MQIFEKIDILDHGYIKLLDCMPHPNTSITPEQAIVDAARVSYSAGTVKKRSDQALIRYLMRNWHTSVFEQVELKFIVKMPLFVAAQWHRHRTQQYNQESARYSIIQNEIYVPELTRIALQGTNNKQGSGDNYTEADSKLIQGIIDSSTNDSYDRYEQLINLGVARELARGVLPTNTFTTCYAKANLLNWLKFCNLRSDSHAQHEIRVYSQAIESIIKEYAPDVYQAYQDYWINSKSFSFNELSMLKDLISTHVTLNNQLDSILESLDEEHVEYYKLSKGELREFKIKTKELFSSEE